MQMRPLGNTGLEVSILGFGASPLGGVFGELEAEEGARAVHTAIDLGVNLFDTSPFYGLTRSETALGMALRSVPRDKYILATKVGRYGSAEFDFSSKRVLRSIDESLQRLQTDVIDIITCHDIEFVSIDQVIGEALPALERARTEGKIRFIGVSGLPLKIYHSVLDRVSLDTVLSYCHNTLIDVSLTSHLEYLESKQVGIINASPFAMGLLTGDDPPSWQPADAQIRAACADAARFSRDGGIVLPQLALQYSVSESRIATTLAGMRSQREVEQNVRWAAEAPDPDHLAAIHRILEPVRNSTWSSGLPENQS